MGISKKIWKFKMAFAMKGGGVLRAQIHGPLFIKGLPLVYMESKIPVLFKLTSDV